MINIVVDMMGSDEGSKITVGAIKEYLKTDKNVYFICVGNKEELKDLENESNCKLVYSETVVKMDADPMEALKDKKSSLMMAIKEINENNYDAFLSAGGTGPVLSAATLKIKRLPGIIRPGLLTSFPTIIKDKKMTVCDLGANAECTAKNIEQFAIMSSLFYKFVYGKEDPCVYHLNIGTEEHKGREVDREVYSLLKMNEHINFKGNIEGREALEGNCDCLVCDGYSGNIFLKSTEGCAKMMSKLLKNSFKKNLLTKIGYLFAKSGIDEMKSTMDYKNVGGAMLVGVNKVVVKAHGNSDVRAFIAAIKLTKKLVESNIISKFEENLK